jgi:DNA-binding MarR family transcriptional regulator
MNDAAHLGLLIARTGLVLGKAVEEEFENAGLDLNYQHFIFLNLLSRGNKLIQQDLADIIKIDKSAVLRVVSALEEKNLVERTGDTCDRRRKMLHLTTLGETLLKQALQIEHRVNTKLQKGLTKEEVDTFVRVALHLRNED